ncbi:MAG: AAA family ATPase [Bacteroides sp.]|nr:AAA family ATPase [Bacteroides sp.]
MKDIIQLGMTMAQTRLYPVGYQDFEKIRKEGRLYIDKTAYLYRMTHGGSEYVFLSRPRRFGKTLLTSTLQYYFQGRKELFAGLAMERLETEWTEYPVLRFDLSQAKGLTKDELPDSLGVKISEYEDVYGKRAEEKTLGDRMGGVIKRASTLTGKKVVVLIDEYDAPLLEVVHEEENLAEIRRIMRNFYSPLKACDPYIRFVFLTGITKFSQLSIFSAFNNIDNISMDEEFGGICGITKEELTEQMSVDIDLLAGKFGLSHEETLDRLVSLYDGYHFTWPSADIFNPYSLLKAFEKKNLRSYWFETATPTHLIELMRKYNVHPTEVGSLQLSESGFNIPLEQARNYIPLFYQSGYLTIKDYDARRRLYTLDIPNQEVREGLMDNLIAFYLPNEELVNKDMVIADLRDALAEDDMDAALHVLQEFLARVPYTNNTNYEGHYQQLLYILFTLADADVDVEKHTANGRIDLVLRTKTRLYVMELKLNKDAASALNQINLKNYPARFATCGLPIVKVGINFDSERHTISEWEIACE